MHIRTIFYALIENYIGSSCDLLNNRSYWTYCTLSAFEIEEANFC